MLTSSLLATATASLEWSPNISIIMIVSNIFAIAVGKFTIEHPHAKPELPAPQFFGGFGLPAVLATTSFGHILGAGIILGLHSIGKI
ncbi:MAG: photosystem I reaction center subunit X [Anabaena sp. MDT14b]|jgi:photosystem I subunit 10|nr:MAG: photosystem I reaction center subunit X [Anabaena sp. MDT14b]